MFYFFYKIILIANKEKDNIWSAYYKFSQLGDSRRYCSHNFRASQRYENTLVDQSKFKNYPNNYFIILSKGLSSLMKNILYEDNQTKFGLS